MKLLITGLSGTLAPRLAEAATVAGHEILAWDRGRVDPADTAAARAWLDAQQPDAIAHLAMGSPEWCAQLAAWAAERRCPFVFTSSVMVFDHEPDGPHKLLDERRSKDDYGRYKIACEDAVLAASKAASVVRIGWQIDADTAVGNNNMLKTLDQWQREQGRVAASRAWIPACSFMADTSAALLKLLAEPVPGLAHLDSNAAQGHSFDRIAVAMRERFARDWTIEVHEDYRHDQRLAGGDALMPALSTRLPGLL